MSAPFVWHERIRYVDTDASGRIHFTAMLRYFETAEQEFLRARGVSYQELEAQQLGYPRVHVDCDYTSALAFDDLVSIAVEVARVGRSSFTLAFRASCEGREAAKGSITVVCMDRKTQKSHELPPALAKVLGGS
jgi:YbgC/YbaW family acyl-CoA thioester hydrolase